MSSSATWHNAVAQSSCVPDPYADTSYAEDFAQNNVLYTYKKHIGPIPADTTCLNPQLNVFANTARLATTQTTTKCFPDKRPWTMCVLTPWLTLIMKMIELKTDCDFVSNPAGHAVEPTKLSVEELTKTYGYQKIVPTYFPNTTVV